MSIDWTEVNQRRISEKTQEIQLYCAQKKASMTERAFDLARLSFARLLDNISERYPGSSAIIESVRRGMTYQDECIARITKNQAGTLACGVVYNCIGDDLNLYPVTAEKKLYRAKVRQLGECDISIDEMTLHDKFFVVSAMSRGDNFSKRTMRAVFQWFEGIGLDPYEVRIVSELLLKETPLPIQSLPLQAMFSTEYRKAVNRLIEKGYLYKLPDGRYFVTETATS